MIAYCSDTDVREKSSTNTTKNIPSPRNEEAGQISALAALAAQAFDVERAIREIFAIKRAVSWGESQDSLFVMTSGPKKVFARLGYLKAAKQSA